MKIKKLIKKKLNSKILKYSKKQIFKNLKFSNNFLNFFLIKFKTKFNKKIYNEKLKHQIQKNHKLFYQLNYDKLLKKIKITYILINLIIKKNGKFLLITDNYGYNILNLFFFNKIKKPGISVIESLNFVFFSTSILPLCTDLKQYLNKKILSNSKNFFQLIIILEIKNKNSEQIFKKLSSFYTPVIFFTDNPFLYLKYKTSYNYFINKDERFDIFFLISLFRLLNSNKYNN